jgi:CheY-like chemotaxis protein
MKTSRSIFLIEDDKDDQDFFVEALANIQNAVLYDIANNGKEAIERLKAPDVFPDFIFTDINMPIMDGIECLTQLCGNPQTRHIPVVVLSTDIGKTALALKIGAKAFIKKPGDSQILRDQMEWTINLYFVDDSDVSGQVFSAGI